MKKFISAVTSLAMTVTMASSIAPSVSAADASKGFAIKAFAEAGSKYDAMGNAVTVSKDDIAAGDVVVPVAVYLDEATNDTQAVSVAIKLTSDSADVKNVTFKSYKPTDKYFSAKKSYTLANGEANTERVLAFAGEVSLTGQFTPAGSYEIAADTSQKEAGAENAYIGCSWTNNGQEYVYTGSKSSDHPFFVFDVTLPKGTAAGEYKLEYCKYNTDFSGKHNNPTPMIETTERYTEELGNLKLSDMTITVEGDGSTTPSTPVATTTQPTTTPAPVVTTQPTPSDPTPSTSDAEVVFDFGNWNFKAGDKKLVSVTVDSKGKAISAMDVVFKIDSPLTITAIDKEIAAFNVTAMTNMAILGANFKSLDSTGEPLAPTDDPVFNLQVEVPATTPDGTYNIGFGSKNEVHKSNDGSQYTVGSINGKINVTGGTGDQPAQTTPTPVVTTQPTPSDPTPSTSDAEVVFDFGNWNFKAGDKKLVSVTVDSKGKAISAMDVVFKIDSPLTITAIDKEIAAFNVTAMTNMAILGANFKSLDSTGEPLAPTDDPVFNLQVEVPATTPNGTYNIGFGSKNEVHKSNDGSQYTVGSINGKINVTGGTGDQPAQTTQPTPAVTTTQPTTAPTPVVTTTQPTPSDPTPSTGSLKPVWGDVNCDGDVNVADVVLLNKWLNNNADYAMTDQGKVNADVFNPQDANGGAVDPSKVDLSKADSDAIIRSIVHLITLPAKG